MHALSKSPLLAALFLSTAPVAALADGIGPFTNGVANANPAEGSPATVVSSDFTMNQVVTGTDPVENPSGRIVNFGELVSGRGTNPDQNLYLVANGKVKGPTPKYDYGHHFLVQGHEIGRNHAYVTRVNLDVSDPKHRVTLLTPVGDDGFTNLNQLDGSAYDARTNSMLFTQEGTGHSGGVIEIGWTFPSPVKTHYGSIGRCGVEGVHVDNEGRIYLVEDTGGKEVSVDPNDINGPSKFAKQPNSYIFRFVPTDAKNLDAGGRLEALQVSVAAAPLVFGGTSDEKAFDDVWSPKQVELHSGASFPTRWVVAHDTSTDGTDDFDCNIAARHAGATPFKRPENGTFLPDGTYRTFVFATTGDTNNRSGSVKGLAQRGAWGSLFKFVLDDKQDKGTLQNIVLGDATHNSYDNVTFGDSNTILTTEDRGDTLHDQLDTLDSI